MTRFDLETRAFTDRTNIDETGEHDRWSCCTAVDDAIWLPGPRGSGSLLRFDTATLEVTDTLVLDSGTAELGIGPGPGIAVAGAIWATSPGTVHRIDTATHAVTDIAVRTFRNRVPAFGDGAVWVAGGSTLSRIDTP